jgi:hypothetical protein
MYNKLHGKIDSISLVFFLSNKIKFKKKVSSLYAASTATGTPTNTYSCAATCTATYAATSSATIVTACCATGDNCFANTAAATTWSGLLCNTGIGSAATTVGCAGGSCMVKSYLKLSFFFYSK